MSKYVAVRRMTKRGAKVCVAGWLLLLAASSPIAPSIAWLVLIAWGSLGAVVLSSRAGLEIHTLRGMIRWCGLSIVWPLTLYVAEGMFADPAQWAQPPRATV